MFRQAAAGLAALALTSTAAAECRNDGDKYAGIEVIDAATGSRLEHFAGGESRITLKEEGPATVELVYLRRATLIKASGEVSRQRATEIGRLFLAGHLVGEAVRMAIGAEPCSAVGVRDVDSEVMDGMQISVEGVRFLRLKGTAKADGRGQADFSVRIDTAPEPPKARPLTYTGTITFDDQRAALSGETDVGGFSIEYGLRPAFIAAPGTTLTALRLQLERAK